MTHLPRSWRRPGGRRRERSTPVTRLAPHRSSIGPEDVSEAFAQLEELPALPPQTPQLPGELIDVATVPAAEAVPTLCRGLVDMAGRIRVVVGRPRTADLAAPVRLELTKP